MKRDHSQDEDDRSMSYTDSDNSAEFTQDQFYQNTISVINYSNNTTPTIPQNNEDTNSIASENLVERYPQNDLIRTILNPTPSASVSNKSDNVGSPPGMNNNHSNCNHNAKRQVRSSTVDVTRDVLEDVQK